jgi:hypothetical protein
MAEPENLADIADFLMGVDQLIARGVIAGHARCKLTAVLDIQKHARNKPGNFLGALLRTQGTDASAWQVIDGDNAAFLMKVAHVCIVLALARLHNPGARTLA